MPTNTGDDSKSDAVIRIVCMSDFIHLSIFPRVEGLSSGPMWRRHRQIMPRAIFSYISEVAKGFHSAQGKNTSQFSSPRKSTEPTKDLICHINLEPKAASKM